MLLLSRYKWLREIKLGQTLSFRMFAKTKCKSCMKHTKQHKQSKTFQQWLWRIQPLFWQPNSWFEVTRKSKKRHKEIGNRLRRNDNRNFANPSPGGLELFPLRVENDPQLESGGGCDWPGWIKEWMRDKLINAVSDGFLELDVIYGKVAQSLLR